MVDRIIFHLGQVMVYLGIACAIGAQIFVFSKLARSDTARAIVALVVPFYAVYRVGHIEPRMPRVKIIWVWGIFVFIMGYFVMSIGLDL